MHKLCLPGKSKRIDFPQPQQKRVPWKRIVEEEKISFLSNKSILANFRMSFNMEHFKK